MVNQNRSSYPHPNLTDEEFREIAALADEVAAYFTPHPRLEYGGLLGAGADGGVLLFRDTNIAERTSKRVVVKFSINEKTDQSLNFEAQCLANLIGAEHIVQMIPLPQASLDVTGTKRPTLALEFIRLGDGAAFRKKLAAFGFQTTPSRVLWHISLCLLRACIAMAYPPKVPWGTAPIRELVQDYGGTGLAHNRLHLGNIIFSHVADESEYDLEHGLVPLVKLIDFGSASVEQDDEMANYINIVGVAEMIIALALPTLDEEKLKITGENPIQYQLRRGQWIETYAPYEFVNMEKIDIELRDFIAQICTYRNAPTLAQAVEVAAGGVVYRQPDDIANSAYTEAERWMESDNGIKSLVQQCFLNADRPDVPGGSGFFMGWSIHQQPGQPTEPDTSKKTRPTLYQGFLKALEAMRNTSQRDLD